jgi:hypothetical protein
MADARRIVPWLLLATTLLVWLIIELSARGPGEPDLAPASVDADAAPAVLEASSPAVAASAESRVGAESAAGDPVRAEDGDATARRPAAPDPVDWEQAAREFVATTNDGGDVGLRAILIGLRQQFEGGTTIAPMTPMAASDPFDPKVPSVDELVASSSVNPLGLSLDTEARRQLQGLLDDYAVQIRRQKRGKFLATQVSLGQAILGGDYVRKPNGSDPDGVWKKVLAESERDFPNRLDQNISELPGRDFSHNRIVVLRPDRYPGYLQAIRDLRTTEAELQVAIRTFFLPVARRR